MGNQYQWSKSLTLAICRRHNHPGGTFAGSRQILCHSRRFFKISETGDEHKKNENRKQSACIHQGPARIHFLDQTIQVDWHKVDQEIWTPTIELVYKFKVA